ncbi:MAG: DUF6356 family protein [Pseudomonadales bacterium]|nr:DUF6356 family protein [Pseudomonadales bacterium]
MKRFSAHLEQVNESYLQHMGHALSFAFNLGVGCLVCLVHAFLPFLFEKQGSDIVRRMHDRMVINRHNLSGSREKNLKKRWLSPS